MANTINYAAELQSRFANYFNHGVDRFSKAVDEMTAQTYTSEKLFADSFTAWQELASVLLYPLELTLGLIKERSYEIHFAIKTNTLAITDAIDIPNLGVLNVISTDLTHDDGTTVIASANVVPSIVGGGGILVVALQKLGGALTEGHYDGEILRADNKAPIASVSVDVTA